MPEEGMPCRDFERGVCSRGEHCKYFHPERTEPAEGAMQRLPICKDFQNKGCDRRKCKFLHITGEEEAVYETSGELPNHRGRPELVHTTTRVVVQPTPGKDVCKDFLNGKCDRGNRCKFAHVEEGGRGGVGDRGYGKRSRVEAYPPPPSHHHGGSVANDAALFEENEYLRRKITDLQREVLSLREMNDALYDQNRRYCAQLGAHSPQTPSSPQQQQQQQQQQRLTMLSPTAGPPAAVMYPSYTQTAYPPKAVLPTGSGAASGYSYVHY